MAEANQAGGRTLHGHEGEHEVSGSEAGRKGALVPVRDGAEISHHTSLRGTTTLRSRILRDQRTGVVRRRRHPQGRSVDRWRADVEGRRNAKSGAPEGAHAFWFRLELGRRRNSAAVPQHGRTGRGATYGYGAGQILARRGGFFSKHIQGCRPFQRDSILESDA